MANLPFPGKPAPSEIINIVDILSSREDGQKTLKEMGQRVVFDTGHDDLSRKKWKEHVARSIKVFSSFKDTPNLPWDNAANVNLPMLAVACLQFQARAFDALIPPKGVVSAYPTGEEDIKKADRVQKWMNYELLYKMPDFEEGMDKTLLQLPVIGCVFRKTYYDPYLKCNRSIYCSAEDVIVPYTTRVSIEEAPRKTHILYLTKDEVRKRAARGIYRTSAINLGPGSAFYTLPTGQEIRTIADKQQGVENQMESYDYPRMILEQHRGWDIDGDGLEEPYVITVDAETMEVLRITDRRAYDWEGQEHTIEYFTKYGLIPNPEGFYDLGFGLLITGLNEAANEIVNEVIDAGQLANMQGGFISKRTGIKKGSLKFTRGEFKEVDTYLDDISKAFFNLDFKGPNQTLYAVLGLLYEYSKLVSSVAETMTGQLPASDTPATTVLALIEEGRKVFSSIHKRIHRSFKKELQKLFRLNSIFLPERQYFQLLGPSGLPLTVDESGQPVLTEEVGRSDFTNNIDVLPVSDPNIISRAEKVMKAQQAFDLTVASPATAGNAECVYNAHKRFLEALEVPFIGEILKPTGPPPDMAPEDENASIIQQKPATALPQQDHMRHIEIHDDLALGQYSEQLTPDAKKLLEAHRREHVALQYLADQQQIAAGAQAIQALAAARRL